VEAGQQPETEDEHGEVGPERTPRPQVAYGRSRASSGR
jgi:hypothetical protein